MATSLPDSGTQGARVRFSDALARVREWALSNQGLLPQDTVFLRDLRGRFRVIVRSVLTSPEQFNNALDALHRMLGAYVPIQETTASRLSALIEEVLSNPEYRQNANNMKQVIAETNGLEKAVDLLELAFYLA
jgi:hypothetical protein